MWDLVLKRLQSSAPKEYTKVDEVILALHTLKSRVGSQAKPYKQNSAGQTLIDKFNSIAEDLGSNAVAFTLLRNIPNMTFKKIFDKVGTSLNQTIRFCSNAGEKCTNIQEVHSSYFPKCFRYGTGGNGNGTTVSDEGITAGLTLIFMTGAQLASVGAQKYLEIIMQDTYGEMPMPSLPLFQNTFFPSSANGMRLLINRQGVPASLEQHGIDISPGSYTLIGLTGKEIIRLAWPYSECTETDNEMRLLKQSITEPFGDVPSNDIGEQNEDHTYTQQDCRSACLQRAIWGKCGCLDVQNRLPYENIAGSLLCGTLKQDQMEMFLKPDIHNTKGCLENIDDLISDKCSFLHKMINELACVKQVTEEFSKKKLSGDAECDCPPACYTYSYDISLSESVWPAEGFESMAAFSKLIRNSQWDFDIADAVKDDSDDGFGSGSPKEKSLRFYN